MLTKSKQGLEFAQAKFMSTLDEVYDKLDSTKYEVFKKSTGEYVTLTDFLQDAKNNILNPYNNPDFSPKKVLMDSLAIIENLGFELNALKQRLETNFRSVIDMLEEYSTRNDDLQSDLDETVDENEKLYEESEKLKIEYEKTLKELRNKQSGILPLVTDVKLFFKNFNTKMQSYKDHLSEEEYTALMQEELFKSLRFLELRNKEVMSSQILDFDAGIRVYTGVASKEVITPEIVVNNSVSEEFEEVNEIPAEFQNVPKEQYYKAYDMVKPHAEKKKWNERKFHAEIERCLLVMSEGRKYKP